MRDALGDIAALAYKELMREPVREVDETRGIPAVVGDLGGGVWQPQTEGCRH